MRIGHFAQPLCQDVKTGIGWYTYKLIYELAQMDVFGEVYGFDVLNRHHSKEKLDSLFETLHDPNMIHCKVNKFTLNGLYSRLDSLYSKISFDTLFHSNVNLHHAHNYFLPYNLKKPSIVTIYDLVYKTYPETMDQDNLDILNRIMPRSISESTKILTISENSKKELVDILNVDPKKITIAYPGFDENVFRILPRSVTQDYLNNLGIKKPYILYLGTLEPRKNIERIIEAYASLAEYHRDFDLVLAGAVGWKSNSIFERIEHYQLSDNVHITGYISQNEQVSLYNNATCFVFPSLYEGFGMPTLEAMACGCPVITSNTSSLPEAVGEAGLLVNPLDVDALAQAMATLLKDDHLQREMKEKNKIQIQNFTWHNTAISVLNLYESML